MQYRGIWSLSCPKDTLIHRSSTVLHFSKLPSSLPVLYGYCVVTCMVTILRLVRLSVIPTYIGIIAPGQREFSSSLFKCFLGFFIQGDWRETSTTTAESFQHQQVFLMAYTLPHAVRSPDNIIQKCKTQTLVLCPHKSRFSFLYFSDSALSS